MSDKNKKGPESKTYKFDTLSLHAGYQPHKNAGSRQVPIYQTTSYLFDDVDHAAALFNLERGGHIYSRISNPTVAVLEERVASLEGGTAALATSSGMSAIFLAVMTLCEAGDHLVVSSQLYGGTVNLFRLTLPKFGIKCTFVKPRDTEGFKKAIQKNTKGIFGELVGNPGNEIMNMPEIAKIAHDAGIPLMVDATYQTPYLCKPFEHGADIVIHSLTKYINGHSDVIGGCLVIGKNRLLDKKISLIQNSMGAIPSAFDCFLILRGIKTLSLRMKKHNENGLKIFERSNLYLKCQASSKSKI